MKFDVVFHGNHVTVEPHVATEEGDADGYELAEVCEIVAAWHEKEARRWRDGTHHTPRYYLKQGLGKVSNAD